MSKDLKACMMHNTDHWKTPKKMYDAYINDGYIDPCPFHSKKNNLNKIYKNKKLYINPPYSDIKSWTEFIYRNHKDNQIVLLIPARTDTKYFHKLLDLKPSIYFIEGRIKFNDGKGVAPFPSILMVFYQKLKIPCYQSIKLFI